MVEESKQAIDISIVIPVYNEEENIADLFSKLRDVCSRLNKSYEIIFVDDGSGDSSFHILSNIAQDDSHIKIIQFQKNFGQTAAISAGFSFSKGGIVIPIDADLQNNPNDIPRLLEQIDAGFDIVSGWRKNRKDSFSRRIPSIIANKIISIVTGVHLHDYGCTLKAYRRRFLEDVKLYGEMHRFIPAYASWSGARLGEIEVDHLPRIRGKSKYGLSRTFKVVLDLMTVKFLSSYLTKPIYIFGGLGLILLFSGFLFSTITLIQKFVYNVWVHKNPLILLAVFLFILGVQFIMMGLLAEIIIRTYYEIKEKPPYFIKKKINIEKE